MYSINQLFKWQQAIDDEDISFIPNNVQSLVGKKFNVVHLIKGSAYQISTIVTLKDSKQNIPENLDFKGTYIFSKGILCEPLWWCEVYPYKEENE